MAGMQFQMCIQTSPEPACPVARSPAPQRCSPEAPGAHTTDDYTCESTASTASAARKMCAYTVSHDSQTHPQVVVDNVAAAFLACFECQPIDELVAIGDSLIREQLLDYETFVEICEQSGRKGRRVLQYSDVASDSGLESLLRARLRALRIKLTTQWPVRGARRYDMKIGRSLLIETDGREHHDRPEAFHNDRDADQIAVSRGYVVMRLTYRHVVHEWPDTLERILSFVRRRWHLRRPVELTA